MVPEAASDPKTPTSRKKNRMKRRGLRKTLCCFGKGSAFRVVVIKVRIIDVVFAVVLLLLSIGCASIERILSFIQAMGRIPIACSPG